MTTPDLTAYNELILFDTTAQELAERAVADAAAKLPGWVPRDGNTEMVLIESLALIVAEYQYAVNRIPSAVTESVIRIIGIEHSLGTPATATATFHLGDSLGHSIPAGTVVRLAVGDSTVDFTIDATGTAAIGVNTITVAITSSVNTSIANGVASGTALTLVSQGLPFVDTVALASDVAAGANAESDAEWITRAMQRFARLNDTLVLPAHFAAEALNYSQVKRATAIDNYDGTGTPDGTEGGHITVAIIGSNGATISGGDKTTIEADLESKALANLDVHIIDPTVTTVAVTSTVKALPGYDSATVQANVIALLTDYLNPDTWPWAATVYKNELIALIDRAEGVDRVVSLTAPANDTALSGAAPLADLGAVAITVT